MPIKINLAKSAGFCFGVKRAIDIATKTAGSSKKVYTLGDIVHNEDVAARMEKLGIAKMKRLGRGKNKIFLVSSHGTACAIIEKTKARGYEVVDATCPMVKEIHRIVMAEELKGQGIIVIGDKKHDEVQGIIGHTRGKALVIDSARNIPWREIKKLNKACVVVQSTQNIDKALKIVALLRRHIRELRFFNTVCRPTRIKQQEIKSMPGENDVMIIIGSKHSANTRRLYEISKSINKRSYWVQSGKEVRSAWFRPAGKIKNVGVTAGASTPDATTREVIASIRNIT